MKKKVAVQFIVTYEDAMTLIGEIFSLDPNLYETIGKQILDEEFIIVNGIIDSEYATLITLQNTYLAERMCISYISDELKDQYRT